jgi:hypothetical protein
MQRAGFNPFVKNARGCQKLGKVHDLSLWCGMCRVVPAHVHAPAHGLHCHILLAGLCDGRLFALGKFTHRVSILKPRKAAPALGLRRF